MTDQLLTAGLEKTIRIVDNKGKVLTELQKIVKDVTVEEFKKMLVSFKAFRTYTGGTRLQPYLIWRPLSPDHHSHSQG
jgi:hypothetical protein